MYQTTLIHPGNFGGTVIAPRSKSAMQRACAAALLCGREVYIKFPGNSADDLAALQIIQRLGATVSESGKDILIKANGIQPVNPVLHCGESGLSARMFTPIAALCNTELTITGSGSLAKRPMHFFETVLPQLDVELHAENGHLPITLKGPLQPKNITVNGSLSSQFITGLLMAYAGAKANGVTLSIQNPVSLPYIQLTLNVMRQFGLPVPESNAAGDAYYFNGKEDMPNNLPVHYTVEGDWSGAAFLLVAGAIAGSVTVEAIDSRSVQADRAILTALEDCGAKLSVQQNTITVEPGNLTAFRFDATHCPDLVPPLCALAAYCKGTTVITGTERLQYKESDRAFALKTEFEKMCVRLQYTANEMRVEGGGILQGAETDAHNDHRIAMACAVAALRAKGITRIHGAASVNKSYPAFFAHLQQLGINVEYL